jgi:predicted SAM-dependent methyltransferase
MKNTIVKHASEFYAEYDEHGNITEESKKRFDINGFLTFQPGFIDEKILDNFLFESNKSLLHWSKGEVDINSDFSNVQHRFVNSYIDNDVRYYGCPLQHRLTRGHGSVIPEENKNWLFGKRAVLQTFFWNKEMASIVENNKIQSIAKVLLNTDELSLHNGSVARTYPGVEGEPRTFHLDTSGFTNDPFGTIKNNQYVVNIFTYLSDVTENLAPLRIIPRSHTEYLRINEYICKNSNISDDTNMMAQSNMYEEMLPDFLEGPIKIIGEKGTIIAFHNGLLHATTANSNESKGRTILNCNFSNRDHKKIFKPYQEGSNKFASYVNEKNLIENTYLGKGQKIFLRKSKRFIKGIINSKIDLMVRVMRLINLKLTKYTQPSIPLEHRKYINIGADPEWQHPLFLSMDQSSTAAIWINLSKRNPLPFKKNQFSGIYCSNILNHLKYVECHYILKEIYKSLEIGGVFRIVVPDIDKWLDAYENKNTTFFAYSNNDEINRQDSLLRLVVRQFAEIVVDKFSDDELYDLYRKFDRKGFLNYFESQVNEETNSRFLIADNNKAWYSEKRMKDLLLASGFQKVIRVTPTKSSCKVFTDNFKDLDGVNSGRNPSSLFIEATKE